LVLLADLFTQQQQKKWRDATATRLPATLFFWWLAIEISFLPTMKITSIKSLDMTTLDEDHEHSAD